MSLLDALLLDPAPFNVWVAVRTDGLKGSGTASDPYDGGPVMAATKSITSVTRSGTLATATLTAGHGYQIEVPGVGNLTPPYTFARIWQMGLAIRERNVVEVGQVSPLSRTFGPPSAFVFYTGAYEDQFLFRKVICRENHVSLPFRSQNVLAEAFSLNVESGLVEANWIDLVGSNPWIMSGLGRPWVQQNLTPQGTLQQPAAGMLGDDISNRIQDALLLAL